MKNHIFGGSLVEFVLIWPLAATLLLGGMDVFRLALVKFSLTMEAKETAVYLAGSPPGGPGYLSALGSQRIRSRFSPPPDIEVGEKPLPTPGSSARVSVIHVALSKKTSLLFPFSQVWTGPDPVVTGRGSGVRWVLEEAS